MRTLKLGTRKSLLAWAQSGWVARELERLNPRVRVELFGIETRGDRILDVSLRQVAGKEFFVAEIDDALRAGTVDLTVHSMKDLSLDRPAEFVLGAIPKRENSRDAILFGPRVLEKLRAGKVLRIGTSSPRRLENIPAFLEKALPMFGAGAARAPRVELVEIRGNVNTRLGRVHEPEGSERALDGVVLAFAGLIRLWADEPGRRELAKLLDGVRWMILPLRECPAAPAQGALAVECRAADAGTREVLSKLHDARSEADVRMERQLLADWGGGCHQRFGASALRHPELGALMYVRGAKPDGSFVDELRWSSPERPSHGVPAWNGSEWRAAAQAAARVLPSLDGAVFVAHSRAVANPEALARARVWTSGASSWFRLAGQGIWVEGCAEGMGYEMLAPALAEPVLQLPAAKDWTVLTHQAAQSGWGCRVLATYEVSDSYDAAAKAALEKASQVFWSSGSQFDGLHHLASPNAVSACGPGKTAGHLRAKGTDPLVFPSVEEWKKWLRN